MILQSIVKYINNVILIKPLLWFIFIYQKTFSPDHGILKKAKPDKLPHCIFYPTCSEYMVLSLKKYGFVKGFVKGIWRIFRCNPWNKNYGIDYP